MDKHNSNMFEIVVNNSTMSKQNVQHAASPSFPADFLSLVSINLTSTSPDELMCIFHHVSTVEAVQRHYLNKHCSTFNKGLT